jgi:hypothetical protein
VARRNQVLGLDIGRYAAKAVLATPSGDRVTLLRTASLRLPAGTFDRAAILSRWLRENNLAGNRCAISLSGQQVMFQPMFMVPGDPRTIAQAASMEILKLRDVAAETMTYGIAEFEGLRLKGERRVLMAMARPAIVAEAMELVRALDLEIADLVPAPIALFNALAPAHASGPTVFAHVGGSITEVAVGARDGLMFARAFAVGGQPFTDALAKVRQLQGPHAENLKTGGTCSIEDPDPAVSGALKRVADQWVAEFQSCLAVFNSLFPRATDRPTRLVLSGGGALLPGFSAYVGAKTGLETIADVQIPVEGDCPTPIVWPIAAGLAHAAVKPPLCPISLLPQVVRDEQAFRREKPFWLAAGIAAALILLVSLAGGYLDFKRMEKHLNTQRASLERRKALVAQIEDIQAQTRAMRDMVAPIQALLKTSPTVRDILALVTSAKDPNDWITLVCDGESYRSKSPSAALLGGSEAEMTERRRRMVAGVAEAPTNRPPGLDHIIVEGYTRKLNFSSVKALTDRLAAAPFIASADLLGDDKLVEADPTDGQGFDRKIKRFVIDMKVRTP